MNSRRAGRAAARGVAGAPAAKGSGDGPLPYELDGDLNTVRPYDFRSTLEGAQPDA